MIVQALKKDFAEFCPKCLEGKTIDEIKMGDTATLTRALTQQDIQLFATATGNMSPAHLDEKYSKSDVYHQMVGRGMWVGSMFSSLIGMQLPGPGTVCHSQSLEFLKPVRIGDTVTATVTVTSVDKKSGRVTLKTLCVDSAGEQLVDGEAIVLAPKQKIKWDVVPLPEFQQIHENNLFGAWLKQKVVGLKPLRTAVVHPVDTYSLEGAIKSAEEGMIAPILVGPELKIRRVSEELGIDISKYEILPTKHSNEAAEVSIQLALTGKVEALMKGKISSEELLEAALSKEHGLRTGRRMTHVFALDVPSYPKPLFLTDAAVNIAPTLMDKKDIVQNAIDLFRDIGLGTPRVAILSAVETVNEKIPSTLDATALCKMAERGQITGALVDGPLAFDNAISLEAARIKGIVSEVAGKADILVVPDIESGNMLYKQLRYFSGAQGAGIVLGAKVPIILTSRAGDAESRVTSSALALAYTRAKKV